MAAIDTLAAALERCQIELADPLARQLDAYCRSLWQWNQRLNLTRHDDYEKFVTRDLVDTLHLASLLHPGERVLDLGSGGGVPGVPLAILRPDLQVTLCDSVGKKAQALQAIVAEIGLRLPVAARRAEALLTEQRFDAVTARAVGPLAKLLKSLEEHWAAVGRLLAIKGPKWIDERNEARHHGVLRGLELRKAVTYPMPGTDSESVILKIWPKGIAEQ